MRIGRNTWWRVAGVVVMASLAAGAGAPGAASQPALPGECPPVMAVDDVAEGMTGVGLTVTRGTEPDEFTAEVLGVLRNAIGPGRDLILASLSGPPIVAAGGGIAFGYSGSPVYLNDGGEMKLAGAVAYGLTWGPSPIAGLTPAEDMNDLFDLAGPSTESLADPARIELSRSQRQALARALDAPASAVGGALLRLKTPLAVSGVTGRAMQRVHRAVARQDLPLVPYAAGMVAGTEPATQPAEAGRSFAAALSYGDVGFAAVGTTTVVCDGKAVAFGHPFFWEGESTFGANAADTITIVTDPVFGSYKLAQIAGLYGTVDQDRLAGIRAVLGDGPETTPVSSTVTSFGTGKTRSGSSANVLPEFLPFLTFIHLLVNIDVTIDRIGQGNSLLRWRVSGTRENGEPWTYSRSNRYSSRWDISIDSIWEITSQLSAIQHNRFEDVDITDVEIRRADVGDKAKQYTLKRVLVSRNGRNYQDTSFIAVRPRQTIYLLALLKPNDASTLEAVEFQLRVRNYRRTQRGFIHVASGLGGGFDPCFVGDECEEGSEDSEHGEEGGEEIGGSFPELLKALAKAPKNHRLDARLFLGPELRQQAKNRKTLDRVVEGEAFIRVVVRRR